MSFYLITFPSRAMRIPAEEFQDVVDASHAVVDARRRPPVCTGSAVGSTRAWRPC